jgi:hypothetical protein
MNVHATGRRDWSCRPALLMTGRLLGVGLGPVCGTVAASMVRVVVDEIFKSPPRTAENIAKIVASLRN